MKTVGLLVTLTFVMLSLTGCNVRLPGQPTEAERWRAPADVSDFNQLYQENCAGCHGADGRRGAARSLNDSLYLSFASDGALQKFVG
jgi:mono/diheme cytochrome c family protein